MSDDENVPGGRYNWLQDDAGWTTIFSDMDEHGLGRYKELLYRLRELVSSLDYHLCGNEDESYYAEETRRVDEIIRGMVE